VASKRERLTARAAETARHPHPDRLTRPTRKQVRGYRVVAVSLYTDQANWLDAHVEQLRQGGQQKANRSMVVQQLIDRAKALHKPS
jgi:Trm5-related predicted tRNA methylase